MAEPTTLAAQWLKRQVDNDAPRDPSMPWAFFTLKTGVPGSGKSLTLVDELRQACKSENPPTIYAHGIPNLALPYIPLPVFAPLVTVKGDDGKPMQVFSRTLEVDWQAVAAGSLVVIDEAQHVFPPRGSAGKVPGYVAFLNTHRHKPVLIVLITQHPKLIDGAVRKLISKHQHYRRVFGGGRHICYEWDSCSENLAGFKEATKTISGFPKRAFEAYKSAEAHHKPKFRLPVWLAVPVLAVAGLAYFIPDVYRLFSGEHGKQAADKALSAAGGASSAGGTSAPSPGKVTIPPGTSATDAAVILARSSQVEPQPFPVSYSAPKYWPTDIAGCWISHECVCVSQSGRLVRDLGQMCADIAAQRLEVHPSRPRPVGRSDAPGSPGSQAAALPQPGAASGPAAPAATLGGQRPA